MENEKRILQVDLLKVSTADLIAMLGTGIYDPEQRHQILGELQKRNSSVKKQFFVKGGVKSRRVAV